jgi:hypothetical protein
MVHELPRAGALLRVQSHHWAEERRDRLGGLPRELVLVVQHVL